MEGSITSREFISLLVLNSMPVVCIGMAAQFLLLRRLAVLRIRAIRALAATLVMGVMAVAFSLALSFAFPTLMRDLGSLDLEDTLRFVPAWLGAATALTMVTLFCLRRSRQRRPA
jgi:hypothetical protein